MVIERTFNVVYLGPIEGFEVVSQTIGDDGNVVHCDPKSVNLLTALATAHALIDASMRIEISNQMIDTSPHLKIISTATTGASHIQQEAVQRRKISLRTLREDISLLKDITPAAELSWALLMSLSRILHPAIDHVKAGNWNRELFPGMMLNKKTLGLVGCGRIGQWMARYAEAFGMNVLGYDPHLDKWPENISKSDLDSLARESDFISVHVHLSKETTRLLDREFFGKVKHGSILINTSRGAVIDESALLEALRSGRIRGAGLDVLVGEPEIENHILVSYARENSNLLITPHCAGYSPDAIRIVCRRAAEKVVEYFRNHILE